MSCTDPQPPVGPLFSCARGRRRAVAVAFPPAILMLLAGATVRAQDPFLFSDPIEETPAAGASRSGVSQADALADEAPRVLQTQATRRRETSETGIEGRFGHIAFPTFGRNDSITHLELFPYLRSGTNVWFSDLRLFMSNEGEFGGNAGLGLRHLDGARNVIWGGNLFYDFDQTSGEPFHQIGFGLETMGETFGGRANVYVPIGETSTTFPQRVFNQRFVDDMLVFDVLRPVGEAMSGVDVEWEAAVPGEWARDHALRLFLGAYFFQDRDVPDITGAKAGAQALLFDHVATHTEVTHDETWGTNATLGLTFYFPGGVRDRNWNLTDNRLKDFVRRNYNIIVDRRATYDFDVVAMSPVSSMPLSIAHVSSAAGAPGVGTAPAPYDTLAAALAASPDIVFVHADTVLSESVVLAPGQQLVGEGSTHMVTVAGYGEVMLPTATSGTSRPTLLASAGDAITLSEGSLVSGFIVQDPTGHGLLIDGLQSASVINTDIIGAGGDGLRITNVTGDVLLENVLIEDSSGIGVYVDNLSGTLSALGSTVIDDSATAGLLIENSSGASLFEDLSITNTTAGLGIDLQNNTGETVFNEVTVATDGGTGLQALSAGTVIVDAGEIATDNAAAVDIEDTAIGILINRIESDGGAVGVRLVDTTGGFVLVGGDNFGEGGFIINKTTGVLLENVENVFFNSLDLDANGLAVQSTGGTAVGFNGARIANSTGLAIDSLNDEFLQVSQSVFMDNGAAGGGTIRYRADTAGDYTFLFAQNEIDDADAATAVTMFSEAGAAGSTLTLQAVGNSIQHDATGSTGMNIDWNGAVTADISSNQFGSEGDGVTGLVFNASSTSDASILQVQSNTFLYSGNNIVASKLTSDAPLSLNYQTNLGIFTGNTTRGLEATFGEQTNATIATNRFEHQGGGGTTILFNDVAGGSAFSIENNLFIFPDNGPVVERGIIFNNVTGGTINLFGSLDNRILDSTQPFFAPAGTTTGSIQINGASMP